jgi:hypothetical protein
MEIEVEAKVVRKPRKRAGDDEDDEDDDEESEEENEEEMWDGMGVVEENGEGSGLDSDDEEEGLGAVSKAGKKQRKV